MKITFSDSARAAESAAESARCFLDRFGSETKKAESDGDFLLRSIDQARNELARAEALFNGVTEQSAIDYASYSILAARAKYVYLLEQAKKLHIHF